MCSSRYILLKLFYCLTILVLYSQAQSPCDIYTEHFECPKNENPTASRPLQEEYDCNTDLVGTTLDLMSRGDEEIELSEGDEAVMLIGTTGTGKSTLGYFLAGNNSMMISYKKSTNNYLIKDCNGKISTNSTIVSATIFPDLIVHESGLAFYDNPGFYDTRTSCVEIANAYFMRKVAEHVKKVKFVVVINHIALVHGQDRKALTDTLRSVMNFLPEVEKYGEALTLMGTKLNVGTEPNENEYISDARNFMEESLDVLDQVFTDGEELRKATFIVNTLISKTENKIGLFRTPSNCGLLSELDNMQDNKRNLSRVIIDNSEFVASDPSDYSYGLSPATLLIIEKEIIPIIHKNVFDALTTMCVELVNAVTQRIGLISDIHERKTEYDNMSSLLTTLQTTIEGELSIPKLGDFIIRVLDHVKTEFPSDMKPEFSESITKQYARLNFTDTISAYPWDNTDKWLEPFQAMGSTIQDEIYYIRNFVFMLFDELAEDKVQVSNSFDILKTWWNGISQITTANFDAFWTAFNITNTIKSIEFPERIKSIAIKDSKKLSTLTLLLNTALTGRPSCATTGGVTTYNGTFVKFGDGFSCIQPTTTRLVVTATHTIYIDKNIKLSEKGLNHNFEMLLLSPKLWVNDQVVLDLSGREGNAPPGKPSGAGTTKGEPGDPGKNAGNVYVVAQTIDKIPLFELTGGRGGVGQGGQNGREGARGAFKNFREDNENDCAAWSGGWIHVRIRPHTCNGELDPPMENGRGTCKADDSGAAVVIFGEKGGSGYRGNDGGAGGLGGNGGKSVIYNVNSTPTEKPGNSGATGSPGAGGDGGAGGIDGDENILQIDDASSGSGKWCKEISQSQRSVSTGGSPGSPGSAGTNSDGIRSPVPQTFSTENFNTYIQLYKEEAGLVNEFLKKQVLEFVGKLP